MKTGKTSVLFSFTFLAVFFAALSAEEVTLEVMYKPPKAAPSQEIPAPPSSRKRGKIPCGTLLPQFFLTDTVGESFSESKPNDGSPGTVAECAAYIMDEGSEKEKGFDLTIKDCGKDCELAFELLKKKALSGKGPDYRAKETADFGFRSLEYLFFSPTRSFASVYFVTEDRLLVNVNSKGPELFSLPSARRIARQLEIRLKAMNPKTEPEKP